MARKYFGGMNPLGRRYRVQRGNELLAPIEIVGIVKDAKSDSLRETIPPTAYVAWGQKARVYPSTNFELHPAGGEPTALIASVKAAIGEVDRNTLIEFTTLADKVNHSLERERLLAMLSGFFGALALLLAAIGLYGVMSHNAARRRNEVGIRMALGRSRRGC